MEQPRTFCMLRHRDRSGVSGIGVVADAVLFPSGRVALAWRGTRTSVAVYESLDDVVAIHGHDGDTDLVPYDELDDSRLHAVGEGRRHDQPW